MSIFFKIFIALYVMSSKLPMGVGTMYNLFFFNIFIFMLLLISNVYIKFDLFFNILLDI
ncbi:hypothetical protein ONB71_00125 [Candidatus Purcelliella pentastirinorum]|uniref:Uncharacterized protein n=1 Tax=Candidatus Purcelliella pentastirinorum TaxID=472834 RepID=A0AAX3N9L6_9ENTR|nr:hypothetical protein [Candidatus Purcelliella pentastirinorum]WDI78550.1 hypothetical protein ONB71_00125 [Candidatus Purcelliella pentastirinorum]